MAENPDEVYRDFNTAGVPGSGPYKPEKRKIRKLLKEIAGGTSGVGDYRGAWSGATAYNASDLVEYGGSIWYAKLANTNVTPVAGVTWDLFLPGVSVADGSVTEAKLATTLQAKIVGVAANRAALAAMSGATYLAVDLTETGRKGLFNWNGVDLSGTLLGAAITSTAVNSTTETITKTAHGLKTGDAVIATTAVNGLAIQTLYYVIRVDADNFRLASSLANALAGTAFNLTGTTNFAVRQHMDPRQGIYVTLTGDITGASGAWVRVFEGRANAQWFDALGDNSANDSGAVNAALVAWRDVFLPATTAAGALATYRLASTINIGPNKSLVGDDSRTRITLAPSMSVDLFSISGVHITIKNLVIYGDGTQTNWLFKLRTDLGSVVLVTIDNVWSDACHGILADANSSNVCTNLFVTDCTNTSVRGRSVDIRDCLAFIFFTRVTWDYVGVSAASSNTYAVYVENNEGVIFTNCDVLGGTKVGFALRDGFRVVNSRAVWFVRCMADHMGGYGYYINNCDYVYFDTCTASLNNADQFYINTGSTYVTAANCYAGGSNLDVGNIAGVHGWLISDSLHVTISGGSISNNTGKAIVTTGATTRFIGTGIAFVDNAGGNYTLGSTLSHLGMCTLSSGALLTSATNTSG